MWALRRLKMMVWHLKRDAGTNPNPFYRQMDEAANLDKAIRKNMGGVKGLWGVIAGGK